MNMFYAVLAFVMTVNNLIKGLNNGNAMNLAMAAMWLVIGIVYTAKHVKERKKAAKRKEEQNKEV